MKTIHEYRLNHYIRNKYHDGLFDHLQNNNIGNIFIHGKSGVGKTTIVTDVLKNILENDNKIQVLYFDSLLGNGMSSKRFIEAFVIECLLHPTTSDEFNINHLSDECTFTKYLSEVSLNNDVKATVISMIEFACSFLPINGDLSKLFNQSSSEDLSFIDGFKFQEFINEYFRKTFGKKKLVVIIDNIQQLHSHNIKMIKTIFKGIICTFIQIYREDSQSLIDDKVIQMYTIRNDHHSIIEVTLLDNLEIEGILALNIDDFDNFVGNKKELLVTEFKEKSNENAYELMHCIAQYKSKQGNEFIILKDTSSSVYNLDLISKQILYLISLLKKGLSNDLLRKTFIDFWSNEEFFDVSIGNLITQGYIDFNEHKRGLTKLSHEKVLTIMDDFSADDKTDFLDVLPSLIDVLIKEAYKTTSNFAYLASSIISLMELNELGRDLYVVYRYIDLLYDHYSYAEIVSLYKLKIEKHESSLILNYFPISIVKKLLDSLQKTGNFGDGINLVNELKIGSDFEIYRAKYLLQQYCYDEAFDILNTIEDSSESKALYLNGLQHLRRDKEAIELINSILNTDLYDNHHYIIMRNSAHLFDPTLAIKNLTKCVNYFPKESFYQATSFNNLGISELYNQNYHKSKINFELAEKKFSKLNSNEVYQAYFNLSTYYLLTDQYQTSLEYIRKGFEAVPKSLNYDVLKFMNNYFIIQYYLDENRDKSLLANRLLRLFDKAMDVHIEDPNLCYLIAQNIISIDSKFSTPMLTDIITFYPGLKGIYNIIKESNQFNLLLSISPHWRF